MKNSILHTKKEQNDITFSGIRYVIPRNDTNVPQKSFLALAAELESIELHMHILEMKCNKLFKNPTLEIDSHLCKAISIKKHIYIDEFNRLKKIMIGPTKIKSLNDDLEKFKNKQKEFCSTIEIITNILKLQKLPESSKKSFLEPLSQKLLTQNKIDMKKKIDSIIKECDESFNKEFRVIDRLIATTEENNKNHSFFQRFMPKIKKGAFMQLLREIKETIINSKKLESLNNKWEELQNKQKEYNEDFVNDMKKIKKKFVLKILERLPEKDETIPLLSMTENDIIEYLSDPGAQDKISLLLSESRNIIGTDDINPLSCITKNETIEYLSDPGAEDTIPLLLSYPGAEDTIPLLLSDPGAKDIIPLFSLQEVLGENSEYQ